MELTKSVDVSSDSQCFPGEGEWFAGPVNMREATEKVLLRAFLGMPVVARVAMARLRSLWNSEVKFRQVYLAVGCEPKVTVRPRLSPVSYSQWF